MEHTELVNYQFEIKANDGRKEFTFQTKPEHNKIKGIFLTAEGNEDLSKCYVAIRIDNKNVISYNEIQASIIQKTQYLSVEDALRQTDVAVNSSTVSVIFTNNSEKDLRVNLNLIAQRNAQNI